MAFNRGADTDGAQCTAHPHPICTGCDTPVVRRQFHVHSYKPGGGINGTFCQECYDLIIVASRPILEAITQVGLTPTAAQLDRMVKRAQIGVLMQTGMALF